MKKILILPLLLIAFNLSGQVKFDDYFTDKVLRFDFMFAGNSDNTSVFPMEMKEEAYYAGSRTQLVDPFGYGNFKYELYDANSGTLLFSKGFCTLFQEWQTTAEAKQMNRSFYEVVTMPFPKEKARFVISERKRNGKLENIYETEIDPDSYFIIREQPVDARFSRIIGDGDPANSVDIVFIAEGYTATEMEKFRLDVKTMADILLDTDPFNSYSDKINIWAVEAVSQESGTDIPGKNIFKNTALNSTFYTFDIERYLTTIDIKSVNDFAGNVPHDNIVILVNTDKYGGGGVYNYYSITAADNEYSKRVFVHELGHSLVGLADEYYTSEVAYEDFYPFDVEPWEPNITTMVDFDAKWKDLLDPKAPVPTPATNRYINTLGVFEGGGYSAKGIYRPKQDCTMKSNTDEGFCDACKRAIIRMIEYYTN